MRYCLIISFTLLTGTLVEAKGLSKRCQDNELMYCMSNQTGQCEEIYATHEVATEECNKKAERKIRRTCGETYRGLLFGSRETCDQVLAHQNP